jgi:mRNA-degrading endonuclease RelE of RelBE toxin-antitoxin system
MYTVLVSKTFQKQFHELPIDIQKRIRAAMAELGNDPFKPRSGADIKPLHDTNPTKHRLRVGEYRIIYHVEGKTVEVIELFHRGRGYRE